MYFHENDDLVTVAGKVDMRELVWYLKNKLKSKVEVVSMRKSNTLVDDKHSHEALPTHSISPEKKFAKVHQVGGGARKEGPIKGVTPATLPLIYGKDVSEKGISKNSTYNDLPPLVDQNDSMLASYNQSSYDVYCSGYSSGAYHCLYHNHITDMFSDENANACSIM